MAEQEENAPPPMLVTELGMVTEVRAWHAKNALVPMEVTLPGIVTEVSLEQKLNAK